VAEIRAVVAQGHTADEVIAAIDKQLARTTVLSDETVFAAAASVLV
jgi:4-aminobutyrate aminotransferase-like enzyme